MTNPPIYSAPPEEEVIAGKTEYLEVLRLLHQRLDPRLYLEIGVRHGRSLALAQGPAVGIDPAPELREALGPTTRVVTATSDAFFTQQGDSSLGPPLDFAFIDGMHLFEYALRDWIQVERRAEPTALVVIYDIFPNHPRQALRERATRVWTGDVWRLHACLAERRPDLLLLPLDTRPTGLLLVAALDAGNRVLQESYEAVLSRYLGEGSADPPPEVLQRRHAVAPEDPLVDDLLGLMRRLRDAGAGVPQVRAALAPLRKRLPEATD